MVLALLGYGLQAYGSSEKTQAQQRAQVAYNQWLNRNNTVQNNNDTQLQDYLNHIAGQYNGDVNNLAQAFNPQDRMAAFNQGQAQQGAGIQSVLNAVNQRNPVYTQSQGQGGGAGLFANAQAQEAGRVATRTAPVADASALSGGLTALATRDNRVSSDFADKARGYNANILDAMRLYQLGNATRNQALERAALQNQQDMSKAQLAGNGAMLAGGLLGAAGQAYGSYQASQPSAASQAYNTPNPDLQFHQS